MKIIFYSSIILLLSHNLYGMKRDYSTNTNQKKNNIEIYEDLEDGVNPDSENFTLYNDKRLLKKTDEVIVKDSFTAISPTLKVNHKTELKMAEQQVKKLYELDKEKESFSFTYESQKILHQKEYLTFSKVYYDRLFGAENLINDLYHRFPPQLIAVILQNGNKFDEDLDRNKIGKSISGVLYSEGPTGFSCKIMCARIFTDKNDAIWHIGFDNPSKHLAIPHAVKKLHTYIEKRPVYMKEMLEKKFKNISFSIKKSINVEINENNSSKNEKHSHIQSVPISRLSLLGDFPDEIIPVSDLINVNNRKYVFFPMSYEKIIGFIVPVDFIKK